MGSSPSLMHRLLHCCQAGIVALVVMVVPLSMRRRLCSPGTVAIAAITLLPSLQLRCCHCQAGVAVLIMMALLPSLMRKHLCHCHNGVVALVALAPLPTWHKYCCPCCAGVIIIILLTSLPSHCMGIVTVVPLALLPYRDSMFALWSVGMTI
jgi:hypothetical protein